jgi:peptide chain release factor 1
MLSSVQALLAEHAELQQQLSEASVHANPVLAKKLNRRYAELNAIVSAYHVVNEMQADLDAAKDMAKEDESFADEVPAMEEKLHEATEKLRRLLIPRDPDDGRDVIMEIKAGEGGAESALFAADLFRMYIQYANSKGWKTEILDKNESDLGGYKDVQIAIKGKSSDPAEGVWAHLKYEGGVHRVQRVPVTETQGRIHTSAAGVLVFPEVDAPEELEIAANEIRVDVFRSSGPGGQGVNTTDSAVRLTHIPTGIVVSCQNERSQIQNKATAMAVLQSKLLERRRQEEQAKINALKGDNSGSWGNQMRSYVLAPYQMVKDLRNNHETGNTSAVLNGEIDDFIEAGIRWRRSQATQ